MSPLHRDLEPYAFESRLEQFCAKISEWFSFAVHFEQQIRKKTFIANKLTNNSQLGPPAPPVYAVLHCQYWQCKSRFFATSLLAKEGYSSATSVYNGTFFAPTALPHEAPRTSKGKRSSRIVIFANMFTAAETVIPTERQNVSNCFLVSSSIRTHTTDIYNLILTTF